MAGKWWKLSTAAVSIFVEVRRIKWCKIVACLTTDNNNEIWLFGSEDTVSTSLLFLYTREVVPNAFDRSRRNPCSILIGVGWHHSVQRSTKFNAKTSDVSVLKGLKAGLRYMVEQHLFDYTRPRNVPKLRRGWLRSLNCVFFSFRVTYFLPFWTCASCSARNLSLDKFIHKSNSWFCAPPI